MARTDNLTLLLISHSSPSLKQNGNVTKWQLLISVNRILSERGVLERMYHYNNKIHILQFIQRAISFFKVHLFMHCLCSYTHLYLATSEKWTLPRCFNLERTR